MHCTITSTIPELQILFKGSYHVMVTTSGDGYSGWNGLAEARQH
ncbi:MAG: hypothetical protein ABI040_00480 [Rhodoferax sp.]